MTKPSGQNDQQATAADTIQSGQRSDELLKESVSAMLDGEASSLELRRVLKASETDQDILVTWQRFGMVKDLMKDPSLLPNQLSSDFASRVASAIENETIEAVTDSGDSLAEQSPWRGFGRVAIAASVAVIVVVGMQSGLLNSEQGTPQLAETVSGSAASVQLTAEADFTIDPEARRRMVEYISAIKIDEDEPAQTQHLQDSPLYRLVNAESQAETP